MTGLCSVQQAHFALREGDSDAVFLEGAPNGEIDVGNDVALALLRIVDPEPEFEIDCAIGKLGQEEPGGRLGQNARVGLGRFDHQAACLLKIGVVGDANAGGQANLRIGVGLVLDGRADQRFVGNDEFGAAGVLEHGIARGDLGHLAAVGTDLDDIADANGAVEQDDEAGHVVAGDSLQAHAETNAEGAGEDRQRGHVDADQAEAGQDGYDGQHRLGQSHADNTQVGIERLQAHQFCFDDTGDPQCKNNGQENGGDAAQYCPQVDVLLADVELHLLHGVDDERRQVGDVQRQPAPDGGGNDALPGGQPGGPRKGLTQYENDTAHQRHRAQQRHGQLEQVGMQEVVECRDGNAGQHHTSQRESQAEA